MHVETWCRSHDKNRNLYSSTELSKVLVLVLVVLVECECIIFLCSFVERLRSLQSLVFNLSCFRSHLLFLIRFGVNVSLQPALANAHFSNFHSWPQRKTEDWYSYTTETLKNISFLSFSFFFKMYICPVLFRTWTHQWGSKHNYDIFWKKKRNRQNALISDCTVS